jgi:hypothetical protein
VNEGRKEWIKRGFDDGVFLVVGGIVAHDTSLSDRKARLA